MADVSQTTARAETDESFLRGCRGLVRLYQDRTDDCCRLTPGELARLIILADQGLKLT